MPKFTVKTFVYEVEKDSPDVANRKVQNLGENLPWEDAKKMRKENKGSWIVKSAQ